MFRYFNDPIDRSKGDREIRDVELLQEDKVANASIYRYVIKSPNTWIVSDREVVAKVTVRERWPDADSTSILYKSCDHPKYPAGAIKNFVRSISFQAWVIKKTVEADKFECSMYTENNAGGSIPLWILNKAAGKIPKSIYGRLNKRARGEKF